MRLALALVAVVVILGCSRSHGAAVDGGSSAPMPSTSDTPTAAGKGFGASCVEDRECASAVCFHKRLKRANQEPEHRGGSEAVEHDGYCSMSCNSDSDCPAPPTNGRCGARGMCKRPE